ncbi:hypothetical protein pdam_00021295 [Pocillopora damicornis]|uniref:Uncharacterized protein n=1 Tax=Pocillopora damicornis TaxID=46731 RepID=A0A3M6V9J4_POCDA|nr:hypothetical protein pdam_00021295 [Pocillopora damicornis]
MLSSTSFERAMMLAVFSLFVLCVTFVIRKELHEEGSFEYQDTARAKKEIDQSYELLIASSEQDDTRLAKFAKLKTHKIINKARDPFPEEGNLKGASMTAKAKSSEMFKINLFRSESGLELRQP